MRRLIRPCLAFLVLAAFVVGCGNDSNPKAVNVKPDTRLQRVGDGNPAQGGNQPALPP